MEKTVKCLQRNYCFFLTGRYFSGEAIVSYVAANNRILLSKLYLSGDSMGAKAAEANKNVLANEEKTQKGRSLTQQED